MALSSQQKLEIRKTIEDAINEKLANYKLIGDFKPFHEKLFSKERIRESSFLHSCSTTIGVTLFQNIAYIIAKENKNFKKVEKQFEVKGSFTDKAKSIIEDIIFDLGRKKKDPDKKWPDIKQEIGEVLKASGAGRESTQIADLFILDLHNQEFYIEIKTIKPNKGECKEAKRGLLKIAAIRNKPITVFVGMGYNPYAPAEFVWPLPLNYFKPGEDLITGKPFWDFLGGKGIYEELLDIFEEAGKGLRDKIENKIEELRKI